MKEELTITRALKEKKEAQKKSEDKIAKVEPMVIKKGTENVVVGFNSDDDYKKNHKSCYDSANDLNIRRNKIASAIMISNANKVVKIGDEEMTVAEAIDRKNNNFDENLLKSLKRAQNQAMEQLEYEMDTYNVKFNEHIANMYSGNNKINEESMKITRAEFEKHNKPVLVEAFNVQAEIERLEKKVSTFNDEVDIVLSEINATTKVGV